MNGDLISRKSMLRNFNDWQMELSSVGNEREYNLLEMIIHGVENQPVAFDPESLISKMKSCKSYENKYDSYWECEMNAMTDFENKVTNRTIDKMIEIIKESLKPDLGGVQNG